MPQIGEQVFYKNGTSGLAQKGFIVGETKRSWYTSSGPNPWWARDKETMQINGNRYEKKELIFITAEEYAVAAWA